MIDSVNSQIMDNEMGFEVDASAERLRLLGNAVPCWAAIIKADGRHAYANNAYAEWVGATQEDLPSVQFPACLGHRGLKEIQSQMESAVSGRETRFETWISNKAGFSAFASFHFIPEDAAGPNPGGFLAIINDITHHKKHEQERDLLHAQLAGHRERLIDLVRSVPGVVWEAWGEPSHESQRINFVSSHAEALLGYPVEEWLATPGFWLKLIHPEDRDRAKGEALEIFHSGLGGASQYRWVARDGRVLWIETTSVVTKDKAGTPLGMRAVSIDISKRKAAEAGLQRLNQDLEERIRERTATLQETNEQMETFCYSVSHDLRAPLRSIRGFARALLEDHAAGLDETGLEFATRIESAAQRMDSLILDLLEYSRIGRLELKLVALHPEELLKQVLSQHGVEIQRSGAIVNVARPLTPVLAQPAVFRQVVGNVIENAVKFVQPGEAPRVDVWTETLDGMVRLCVKDNGIGIPASHAEKVFGVFERLREAEHYPGTGIGLAIVRKGMERMRGRVGFESTVNQGSCFWLEFQPVV